MTLKNKLGIPKAEICVAVLFIAFFVGGGAFIIRKLFWITNPNLISVLRVVPILMFCVGLVAIILAIYSDQKKVK